ncbi:MAG: hypothetical protein COA32_10390 [Fluviicola sp.]|nr:MAG: hypothetical protein COA32_10390 [Fluviicola sp.]
MNLTQRQDLLDLIEKLESFDFIGFLKSQGIENLDEYQYNDRPFSEFTSQYERMLEQLQEEINSDRFRFLPLTLNSNTEFGNINLVQDSNSLLSAIKVHDNEPLVTKILDKLIFYQVNFGFWDRSSVNLHDPRSIDIKRRLNELDALDAKFKSQREKIEKDLQSVSSLLSSLNGGLEKITSNSSLIAEYKQEGETTLTLLKRNLEDSGTVKTQINELQTKITESLNKVSTDINENSKKFNEIVNEQKNLETELKKTIESSSKTNEKVNKTNEYIDSQKSQIEKMVGLATDGAIGYKFDERQKNIFKNIWFWKIAVPLSYVVAAVWVIIVFTSLSTDVGNVWLNLLISLVKTTPAWFLVAFTTNQYKKEREYEEEYAFKSAVAMTITSYTSLLSNDDVNQMKTKDQVLSKVLDKLYSSPLRREEDKQSLLLKRSSGSSKTANKAKELEEVIKPIVDLLKEVNKSKNP